MLVEAERAFFIKLGEADSWSEGCLSEQIICLGYYEAPHEMALAGNAQGIQAIYKNLGRSKNTCTSYANQVLKFYEADPETLWVTFLHGHLWWCKLSGGVIYLGPNQDEHPHGSRFRRCDLDYPWSNKNTKGEPLLTANLSGNLTQVAGFQSTICKVHAFSYLLHKINGMASPEIDAALKAKDRLLPEIQNLIRSLTWKDFELLTDLVFSRSGWQRIGKVGGPQKTVDIELEMPITGERAFVQVKSETGQKQLNEYARAFSKRSEDRMFYVYHTAANPISTDVPGVDVIGPDRLAEMVFDAGLFRWLADRAG